MTKVLCCNLPATLISNDDYRTRYKCIACKKDKYVIKDRSDGFQGKQQLTTAPNGDLYSDCGICGLPVKYSDLFERDSSGGSRTRQSRSAQRVTILVKWEQKEIPYWYKTLSRTDNQEDYGLGRGIKIVNVPILRSVAACSSCYGAFERQRPTIPGTKIIDKGALHFIQL